MRQIFAALLLVACTQGKPHEQAVAATTHKEAGAMNISSPAFTDRGSIPSKYTCDGANTSPPLVFAGVPADAKSLALIVEDPDAPGGTFDHWIVWNIPPSTKSVAEGKGPGGVSARNGFGKSGYGGPCPPGGEHRYEFKLFALDTTLNLAPSSSKGDLQNAMNGHTVATAEMMGRYKR